MAKPGGFVSEIVGYNNSHQLQMLNCELPMILRLKKLILCNLHKMSFFLILLQLSDRR